MGVKDSLITSCLQRHRDYIIGGFLLSVFFSVITYFSIIYPIFHEPGPSPTIILHDVEIYTFNVSTSASTVTSNLQITIFFRNSDKSIGIHMDEIDVYASYYNQHITLPITLPPKYLDKLEEDVWSPYFNGTTVPMNRGFAESLARDVTAGGVMINVTVAGRFRSSNGFVMVSNQMEVSCPVYVTFRKNTDGNIIGWAVKKPLDEECYFNEV